MVAYNSKGMEEVLPPDLDISGITKNRDAVTINNFIDTFVNRLDSEDRGDEELMMLPLATLTKPLTLETWEWERSLSLTHIIERGLQYPRRAFTSYLLSKTPGIDSVTLGFTADNQLVLGLSIDDADQSKENEVIAKTLLEQLISQYDCHAGIIIFETPPPINEAEFLEMQNGPYTVFSIRKN